MDLELIKFALTSGDIEIVYEFIKNSDGHNEDSLALYDPRGGFYYGCPLVFYEILLSAFNVDRGKLAYINNINEKYDNLILRLIRVAKERNFSLFDEKTLLITALENCMSDKVIDELIKTGSNVTAALTDIFLRFINGVSGNYINVITGLVNRGADISLVGREEGWTLLFYCMKYYYYCPDLITVLLNVGLDVHHLDNMGKNVLMIDSCQCLNGIDCKAKESINVLLKHGICDTDLKHIDYLSNTILHLTKCKYILELAVRSGVSIEAKNHRGYTPLEKASVSRFQSVRRIIYLLKCGANINPTNDRLETVIHKCIIMSDERRIFNNHFDVLAHYGVSVRDRDTTYGRFVQMLREEPRVYNNTLDMLIYHGANIYARNIDNQTPLDIIIKNNYFRKEIAYVIPKHIILFDDSGFEIEKDTLEKLDNSARVRSYIIACKKELIAMRKTFIADGVTFYDFCILKRYYKSKCVNISMDEYYYSCSEIRRLFPIYRNVIDIRMEDNHLKKRELDLRKSFEKIILCGRCSVKTDIHQVLNYDCLYHICRYLNYKQIFNIFSASVDSQF